MKGVHFFSTEKLFKRYVDQNNIITWRESVVFGSLEFISNPSCSLFVVFDNRAAYEKWVKNGCPVEFQLFLF